MTMRKLIATLVVVGAALGIVACDPPAEAKNNLAYYTNAYRINQGQSSMTRDDTTAWTAQAAANRIRDENGSSGCGVLQGTDINLLNDALPGTAAGENIACAPGCGNASVDKMLAKWQNQATTRNVWLDPRWTGYNVGLACNNDTAFGTQHFHN